MNEGAWAWDAISLEVFRSSLLSIVEEMLAALWRSGHSPSLKERRDCSASIYSPGLEMVVQAEHIPIHLGVMPYALKSIAAYFPPEHMQRGDGFITNDPYLGMANHLPDLIVGGPLFVDGKLVGFVSSMAHHSDVGGAAPRSMPALAKEIFQEGLRIPPIQLVQRGDVLDDTVRFIAANSRTPSDVIADLTAQIASVRLAQRRVDELSRKYDVPTMISGMSLILDRSEAAMREHLRTLPNGKWVGHSVADYAVEGFPICATVILVDDELTVDFTGTAEQCAGPFNAALANTYATVLTIVRNLLGTDVPPNAGLYRPLNMVVPSGTIVNPRYPAAVSAATQVSYHTHEALMRAMEPLAPDLVIADSGGGGVYSWGGLNPQTGRLYAYGEAIGGGLGAGPDGDGESAVMPPVANLRDTPTESLEMHMPIRVERYELVRGSGGAGRFRGGLGIRRVIRMLAPATWSIQISMSKKPPYGLHGGGPGAPTRCTLIRADGAIEAIEEFTTIEAEAGDVIVIETAGGGGYGVAHSNADRLHDEEGARVASADGRESPSPLEPVGSH